MPEMGRGSPVPGGTVQTARRARRGAGESECCGRKEETSTPSPVPPRGSLGDAGSVPRTGLCPVPQNQAGDRWGWGQDGGRPHPVLPAWPRAAGSLPALVWGERGPDRRHHGKEIGRTEPLVLTLALPAKFRPVGCPLTVAATAPGDQKWPRANKSLGDPSPHL